MPVASAKPGFLIAELPDGHFWARELIGASSEDRAAFDRGELPQERVEMITLAGVQAAEALAAMDVPGYCDWMGEVGGKRRFN